MILEASQEFTLLHPQGQEAALSFVRSPAQALSQVRFLRHLQANTDGVQGELVVPVPVMGEVDLPFRSVLHLTQEGATLSPTPLLQERAWVEVSGVATVQPSGEMPTAEMHFQFGFRAHLALPGAEGWGGAAFEKMIRAAATRTLERIAKALPESIAAAAQAG